MNRRKKCNQISPKAKSKPGRRKKDGPSNSTVQKNNSPSSKKKLFSNVVVSKSKNVCSNSIADIHSPRDISSHSNSIPEGYSAEFRTSVFSPNSSMVSETCSIDSKVSDSDLLVISSDTDENDNLKAKSSNLSENHLSEFVKNEILTRENLDFSESDLNFDSIASLSESEISFDQIVINKESEIFLPKDSPSVHGKTECIISSLSNCMNSNICMDRKSFINQLNLRPILNSGFNFTNCTHCFGLGVDSISFKDAFEFHCLSNSSHPNVVNKSNTHFKRSPSLTKKQDTINSIASSPLEQKNQNKDLFQSSCDQTEKDSTECLNKVKKQKLTPFVVLERLRFTNFDIGETFNKATNITNSIVEVTNDVSLGSPNRKKSRTTVENAIDSTSPGNVIKVISSVSKQKSQNLENVALFETISSKVVTALPESAELLIKSPKNSKKNTNKLLVENVEKPPEEVITPLTESAEVLIHSPKNSEINSNKSVLENSENPCDEVNNSTGGSLKDMSQKCNTLKTESNSCNSQFSLEKERSTVPIKCVKNVKASLKNKKLIKKIISKTSKIPLNTVTEKNISLPISNSTDLSQISKDVASSPAHLDDSIVTSCDTSSTKSVSDLKRKKKIVNKKCIKSEQKPNRFQNFSITIQNDSTKRKVDSTLQLLDYEKNISNNLEIGSEEVNNSVVSDVLSAQVDEKLRTGKPEKLNGRIVECSLPKSSERRFTSVEDPNSVNAEPLPDDAEILELHLQDDDAALEDFGMEETQPAFSSDEVTQSPTYQSNSADSYKRGTSSEDSESDSDHDFKRFRRESPSEKKNCMRDDDYLPDIRDLDKHLRKLCKNGALNDAINLASRYLPISLDEVKEEIFLKLLLCIFESFSINNLTSLDKWPIMENIMDLINKHDLYSAIICSTIICYCHSKDEMWIYTEKVFDNCERKNIPLNAEAIIAFGEYLSRKLSIPEHFTKFLKFLQFIKNVCKKSIPPKFLHLILKWSMTSEDIYDHFDQICSFLPGINDHEVDSDLLEEFLMFCMKNDWWQYVAKCFLRWVQGPKKILLRSLLRALTAQYMHSEDLLFKFAVAVHGSSGQLSLLHLNVYGQILITFMLEAYEQQKFDIAFNILFILHQQSINYNDLQLSVASYYTDEKSYMKNSTTGDHFLLPQTVSLTAVDTCLQVKRPKDAYEIFKANSWIQVKDVEIPHLQSELFKKKFKCLMKLVRALVNVHPVKGFDAFLVLFKNINSDNFELLNPYKGELDDLFNEYLTNMLNTDEEDKALHLYEYGSEHCKGMLNVDCDILRGFLIKLAQKKKMEKAKNFFHLGQIKKVYSIEKPQQPPWTLTIPSFWTRYEIKFAIEFYFQNLFPLLREKPKQTVFEEWFQVQIVIKEQSDKDSEVNCLREVPNRMVSAMELTSVALKMLDPNLKVEEITSRNMLLIHPKTFYNFWSLKYGAISPRKVEAETFHIQGQKGISFGKEMTPRSSTDSSSSEKFRRLSSPLISPSFSENVLHRGEFTKTIECSPRKEEILHKSAFVKITPPQQSLSKLKPVQNTSHVESQNTIFSPNNVLQVPKKDKLNSAANHIEHTAFNSEFVHRAENTNSTCERCEQLAKCSPVKQTSDCQSSNNNFSDRVFSSCLSNDSSASTSLPKPKRKIVRHNTGIKFINSRPNSPTRLKRIAPSPVMKRAKESLDKAKLFKVPAARTSNNKFENYTISVTGSASRSVIANKEKSVPSCVEPKKAQIQISPLWHKPIQRITALAVNHIECEENSNSSASPPLRTEENKDYSRIKNFLKIKFLQRQGSVPLRPEDLDQRIHLLSLKFMSSFDIEGKLDRTTMKMLTKFAEENI